MIYWEMIRNTSLMVLVKINPSRQFISHILIYLFIYLYVLYFWVVLMDVDGVN